MELICLADVMYEWVFFFFSFSFLSIFCFLWRPLVSIYSLCAVGNCQQFIINVSPRSLSLSRVATIDYNCYLTVLHLCPSHL